MAIAYDETEPIYPEAAEYKAPELDDAGDDIEDSKPLSNYFDTDKSTMSGQVSSLLSQDSDYLKSAKADAMDTAQNRGLLNSTMAATAGTKGAIDAVLPIAEHDADVFAKAGQSNLDTANEARLNNQKAQLEQDKAQDTTALQAALNTQAYDNKASSDTVAYKWQQILAQMDIDSKEKQNLSDAFSAQTQTLMHNIGALLNNPDIKMGSKVTKWMDEYMYEGMETQASLFGLDVEVV